MSTVLLTSVTETPEPSSSPGVTVTRIAVGGDTATATIVNAVVDAYETPEINWDGLDGRKVTILRHGENMLGAPLVTADEGRIFHSSSGALALLPKGKRTSGHGIRTEMVLDLVDGWDVSELNRRVEAVRARFPKVRTLTPERLRSLPANSCSEDPDDPTMCTLALFGTWAMPDAACVDAVWLLHEFEPEDEIAEGVLFVRPESGFSEHGSVEARQLLRRFAEAVDVAPISLRDALALTDADHDEVLALLRAGSTS